MEVENQGSIVKSYLFYLKICTKYPVSISNLPVSTYTMVTLSKFSFLRNGISIPSIIPRRNLGAIVNSSYNSHHQPFKFCLKNKQTKNCHTYVLLLSCPYPCHCLGVCVCIICILNCFTELFANCITTSSSTTLIPIFQSISNNMFVK